MGQMNLIDGLVWLAKNPGKKLKNSCGGGVLELSSKGQLVWVGEVRASLVGVSFTQPDWTPIHPESRKYSWDEALKEPGDYVSTCDRQWELRVGPNQCFGFPDAIRLQANKMFFSSERLKGTYGRVEDQH